MWRSGHSGSPHRPRDARLRGDARGRDGGVREELAAGVVEADDRGGNNRHSALLEREDCTLVPWYRFLTHLAREGRMAVTIGRRELLAALGGAGRVAALRCAILTRCAKRMNILRISQTRKFQRTC